MNIALTLKKLDEELERIQLRATPQDREQAQIHILKIYNSRNIPYDNNRRHPKKWSHKWPSPWNKRRT